MRTRTPLATPVVPAPQPSGPGPRPHGEIRPPLLAPVSVVTPIGEFELLSGALLVGRLPECSICLGDPLVSRMHARIVVQGECVWVEDLHSANGVYLNGMRVTTKAMLHEGDRILIGTTELSLFEIRASSLTKVRVAPHALPHIERVRSDDELSSGPRVTSRHPASFDRVPSTARATALKMVGALADRLATDGDREEAVYVVSGQLRRILQGANAGLSVPPDVAELAAHYALRVARWSGQALWIDYVVELHLSANLLMASATLEEFGAELSHESKHDPLLLTYYIEAMHSRRVQFSDVEQARLELLTHFGQRH